MPEEPQPAVSTPSPPTFKSFDTKKVAVTVIIIVVVLAISALSGWYVLSQQITNNQSKTFTTTKTATSSSKLSTSSATKNEAVRGQTYTNSTYKYKINYPQNWNELEAVSPPNPNAQEQVYGEYLASDELEKTTFYESNTGACQLRVLSNTSQQTLTQWANNYKTLDNAGDNLAKVSGDTVMGGQVAKVIIGQAVADRTETIIATAKYNYIYSFTYDNTKDNPNFSADQQKSEDICKEIIGSFGFLN